MTLLKSSVSQQLGGFNVDHEIFYQHARCKKKVKLHHVNVRKEIVGG